MLKFRKRDKQNYGNKCANVWWLIRMRLAID